MATFTLEKAIAAVEQRWRRYMRDRYKNDDYMRESLPGPLRAQAVLYYRAGASEADINTAEIDPNITGTRWSLWDQMWNPGTKRWDVKEPFFRDLPVAMAPPSASGVDIAAPGTDPDAPVQLDPNIAPSPTGSPTPTPRTTGADAAADAAAELGIGGDLDEIAPGTGESLTETEKLMATEFVVSAPTPLAPLVHAEYATDPELAKHQQSPDARTARATAEAVATTPTPTTVGAFLQEWGGKSRDEIIAMQERLVAAGYLVRGQYRPGIPSDEFMAALQKAALETQYGPRTLDDVLEQSAAAVAEALSGASSQATADVTKPTVDIKTEVREAFQAAKGRAPKPSELNHWVDAWRARESGANAKAAAFNRDVALNRSGAPIDAPDIERAPDVSEFVTEGIRDLPESQAYRVATAADALEEFLRGSRRSVSEFTGGTA